MPLARTRGVVVAGVSGSLVDVEVEVAAGLPSVGVVGLPDASVAEVRWRARSALASIGATWPVQRVTISLSPAEVRKVGAGLDLPIAVGVLVATGQLPPDCVDDTVLLGELGLDGSLRPVRGALAGVIAARQARRIVIPAQALAEVAGSAGVIGATDLAEVVAILRGESPGVTGHPGAGGVPSPTADLADVRGHLQARLALEIAAAGGHHLAMVGSPGVGKTLLAERLPSLLPDLDDEHACEVAAIHALAGRGPRAPLPPFEAPHHSASTAALIGTTSGARVTPGAFVLAHHGVLFMDEAPEFARPSLEALRQPLESGLVSLHRSGWSGLLPASFQLVLAANPCPCGLRDTSDCACAPVAIRRYAGRLSGPLLDRIDLRLAMNRPAEAELADPQPGESSAVVRARVGAARDRARRRFTSCEWEVNARIPAGILRRRFAPDDAGQRALADYEQRSRSLRGPDRVLRVAWTLADLASRDRPGIDDVAMALSLRGASTPWAA